MLWQLLGLSFAAAASAAPRALRTAPAPLHLTASGEVYLNLPDDNWSSYYPQKTVWTKLKLVERPNVGDTRVSIDATDFTFALSNGQPSNQHGYTRLNWGTGADCRGGLSSPFSMNLAGTPFGLAADEHIGVHGWAAWGASNCDAERQVCNGHCGGSCGMCGPGTSGRTMDGRDANTRPFVLNVIDQPAFDAAVEALFPTPTASPTARPTTAAPTANPTASPTAPPTAAPTPEPGIVSASEVCSGEVSISYSSPPWLAAATAAKPFTFSIDRTGSSEYELAPGTFQLKVQYKSCGATPETLFEGESLPVDYKGGDDNVLIEIVALSTQSFDNVDASVDTAPIMVSMQVSPSVVKLDEPATLSFAAYDPVHNYGDRPANYTLAIDREHADISGEAACTQLPDEDGDGRTFCELTFTPRAGASNGNRAFEMVVSDLGGQQDRVAGSIGVSAMVGAGIDVTVNHPPLLSSPTHPTGDHRAQFGGRVEITISATDLDLPGGDVLNLTARATEIVGLPKAGLKTVDCGRPTVQLDVAPADGIEQIFTVVWDPWAGVGPGSSATEFGETWCELDFQVEDSQGQTSQQLTYTVAAIGTPATVGGFGAVPLFNMVIPPPNTAEQGTQIELDLGYADPDSLSTLTVETNGLTITGPEPVVSKNCSIFCHEKVTLLVAGTVGETYTVKVALTDDASPTSVDTRQFQVTVTDGTAHAERLRRSVTGSGGQQPNADVRRTQFQIDGSRGTITATAREKIGQVVSTTTAGSHLSPGSAANIEIGSGAIVEDGAGKVPGSPAPQESMAADGGHHHHSHTPTTVMVICATIAVAFISVSTVILIAILSRRRDAVTEERSVFTEARAPLPLHQGQPHNCRRQPHNCEPQLLWRPTSLHDQFKDAPSQFQHGGINVSTPALQHDHTCTSSSGKVELVPTATLHQQDHTATENDNGNE